MGWGILESRHGEVVQGTIQLLDNPTAAPQDVITTVHLKHTSDGKIVLAPQPSDSPNDPLNWPIWRRDFNLGVVLVCGILSGIHGPIMSPITVDLSLRFHVSITQIAQLSSYMLLILGFWAYVNSSLCRLCGKRGVFVISVLIMTVADIWAATSSSYGSLMGARCLSGFGQAAFEPLTLSLIPDLYFVHERGKRVAVFLLALQTGVYLGVPIATQIIVRTSYEYGFGILALAEGIMTIVVFFFFRETAYRTPHNDPLAHQSEAVMLDPKSNQVEIENTGSRVCGPSSPSPDGRQCDLEHYATADTGPKTFVQHLSLYHGRFARQNFFTLLTRTIFLTFHPTIFWAGLAGLPLSWIVGISFTISPILGAKPYNMSADSIGNIYLAPWIGSVIVIAVFGGLSDWIVKQAARRNSNIYEPEFRLLFLLPATSLIVLGYVGYGWGASTGMPVMGLATFFGIGAGGSIMINTVVISYLLDAHSHYGVESQVILFVMKNLLSFGMGYFFVPWIETSGPKMVWSVLSGVISGVSLFGIVFYVFGKRLRDYFHRNPFLGIVEIDT